ncbi:MAG: hypothetical protein HXY40_09290 [Chloroflexi bacterium]|nr:hypothetical protein [Chloroflexota bacterium]
MRLPLLESERLLIRPFTLDDLEAKQRLDLAVWGETPLETQRAWLQWPAAGYEQFTRLGQPPYGDRALVLKATGEIIGAVGLVPAWIPWDVLMPSSPTRAAANALCSPEMGLFVLGGAS